MAYVARIHLKRNNDNVRKELIDFCLNGSKQYLALGWSRLSSDIKKDDFQGYYNRIKEESGRANSAINVFRDTKADDLFWTRDLNGNYWICNVVRITDKDLLDFYKNNKSILPASITQWEDLFIDVI